MIPIRDTIESKRYPVINYSIIIANIFFYMVELGRGEQLDRLFFIYGLVPARYTSHHISSYFTFGQQIFSFLSFMFLHGGLFHLLGNMWSLYIFGDNVEDRLGHLRYLVFYLLSGIASGVVHIILNWGSPVPTIGASGAIAGVMGAYFILYPSSRILTLIPFFFIPYFIEIPAFFFLGIWFLMQFISATLSPPGIGGIAWWAHVGGFVLGIFFCKLFLKFEPFTLPDRIQRITQKKTTPRLHLIRPHYSDTDLDIYGDLILSPHEAIYGTVKLISIPWGFQRRLFRVKIPPGIRDGTVLRLEGMGRVMGSRRGNLYLRVILRP